MISVRSEVQIFPGPPVPDDRRQTMANEKSGSTIICRLSLCSREGAIAQLGERLLCKQEVVGSSPSGSTRLCRSATPARKGPGNIGCFCLLTRSAEGRNSGGSSCQLVRNKPNFLRAAQRIRAGCMLVLSNIVKRRSFRTKPASGRQGRERFRACHIRTRDASRAYQVGEA